MANPSTLTPLLRPETFRTIEQRCAHALQWRARHLFTISHRLNSNTNTNIDPDDDSPPSRDHIDTTLRHADQTQLRETRALTHDLITSIRAAKSHVESIPTTIHSPGLPPYKLGYLPEKLLTPFRAAATQAIKDAEVLLEHMRDLQHQPYKGKEDNAIVQFEKEIDAMNESEMKERLEQLRREEKAQLSRAGTRAQTLLEDVNVVRETGGIKVVRMANPFGGARSGAEEEEVEEVAVEDVELEDSVDEEEEVAVEEKGKGRERKGSAGRKEKVEKAAPPPTGGIMSLQQKLQAMLRG